ncbi:peptidase inhibitor I78 family protein [Sphingomonas sp. BK235]|nr:peptidase inhibitor I78 family protein [Sphingomonas sp. BK235]
MFVMIAAGSLLMTDVPPQEPPAGSRLPAPGSHQRRLAGAPRASGGCLGADAVGQPWDESRRAALAKQSGREVRVLRVGQPRSMDLREDRLNVILDSAGRVVEITCG